VDLFEKIRTEQAHELPHMTCGGDVVGSLTSIKGACALPTLRLFEV